MSSWTPTKYKTKNWSSYNDSLKRWGRCRSGLIRRWFGHRHQAASAVGSSSEVMDWPHLQAEVGTQTWFCDPSAPWQKGTVENTNRRARRWLPREVDPSAISHQNLEVICARLNATPRKCLGWKTPAEVFKEKVLDQAA